MALPALFAASAAVSAIGGLYSGFSQAKQMEEESIDLDLSANELLFRAKSESKRVDSEAQGLYGQQVTSVAFSGADVSTGSPLLNYAETFSQASKLKANLIRQADLEANALRQSATGLRKQAGKVRKASMINAGAKSIESLYQFNKALSPNEKASTGLEKTDVKTSTNEKASTGLEKTDVKTSTYNSANVPRSGRQNTSF
jgi:hypothetical protein